MRPGSSNNGTLSAAIIGTILGTTVVGGLVMCDRMSEAKQRRQASPESQAYTSDNKDPNSESIDNKVDKNYTLTAEEISRMNASRSHLEPTEFYQGLEVGDLRTFPNAKLLGVEEHPIVYEAGYAAPFYPAKSLLFELDSNKLVTLIAPNKPYFAGQRYDIKYHPFKAGVEIMEEDILKIFRGKKRDVIVNQDINTIYDGLLISGALKQKER